MTPGSVPSTERHSAPGSAAGDQLVFPTLIQPPTIDQQTIQQRFDQFHTLNPWVAARLETMTRDLLRRGRSRVGVKMLLEVIRWDYDRATSGDPFKINNVFASRYTRLLVERHPEWASVFEMRELKSA